MGPAPSSRDIGNRGRQLVYQVLARAGLEVSATPSRNLRYLLVAKRGPTAPSLTILVKTDWKPKPAGGDGPPALAWPVPLDVRADVVGGS
jgi:hypothetical protein